MLKIIKKIVFYFFVFVLTGFCVWTAYLLEGGPEAAILMYHSVGETGRQKSMLNISEAAFRKQMFFLYRHRYRVVSLADLIALKKAKQKIPAKTVVITFDDGYENNYTQAFAVLKEYNFPATIFVIADYAGQTKKMTAGRWFKFMNEEQLREMADSGLITIGAHTRNHVFLPDIRDERRLRDEIYGAKRSLEKVLLRPVEFFSYPVGGYNSLIEKYVQAAGFKAAVTTLPRRQGFATNDLFALKRIKMTEEMNNSFLLFVTTSGYYLKMKGTGK